MEDASEQKQDTKREEQRNRGKQIISQVYHQLTKGCGKEFCTNKD